MSSQAFFAVMAVGASVDCCVVGSTPRFLIEIATVVTATPMIIAAMMAIVSAFLVDVLTSIPFVEFACTIVSFA